MPKQLSVYDQYTKHTRSDNWYCTTKVTNFICKVLQKCSS